MDQITILKQLIAALQALVALYMGQLAAQTTPVPTPTPVATPTPIVYNQAIQTPPPMPIGAPDLSSVQAPPTGPTCTLSVVRDSEDLRSGDFTWSSEGVNDPVNGQIFVGDYYGIGGGETVFRWTPIGRQLNTSSGYISIPQVDFQLTGHDKFRLELNGISCEVNYTP